MGYPTERSQTDSKVANSGRFWGAKSCAAGSRWIALNSSVDCQKYGGRYNSLVYSASMFCWEANFVKFLGNSIRRETQAITITNRDQVWCGYFLGFCFLCGGFEGMALKEELIQEATEGMCSYVCRGHILRNLKRSSRADVCYVYNRPQWYQTVISSASRVHAMKQRIKSEEFWRLVG